MPLRSRCLSPLFLTVSLHTASVFWHYTRMRSGGGYKKKANRRVKSSHCRRRCSAYIPFKIPAAERRWAVRVSEVFRSIFPLSLAADSKKKKGTAHIPAIFSSPAQQRHSVAVGVSLCARVCLLARVSSRACVYVCLFLFFPPPASLFNSLFVYYRLQRGAVIQFCNHHTGGGGESSTRRGFFGWLPSETHAPPAPFPHTHPPSPSFSAIINTSRQTSHFRFLNQRLTCGSAEESLMCFFFYAAHEGDA